MSSSKTKPNCSNENLEWKVKVNSVIYVPKRGKEGVSHEEFLGDKKTSISSNKAKAISELDSKMADLTHVNQYYDEPWTFIPRWKQPHVKMMEDFDVLCLQETKLHEKDVDAIKRSLLDGYQHSFWACNFSTSFAYSGTAIISRIKPLSVRYGLGISKHDSEGRLVTLEFDTLILRRPKPVVLTGDLNCAYENIDIHNPDGSKRKAGFTLEERQSFKTNFLNKGFVDTFRHQHRRVVGYTFWGWNQGRDTNKGWRLDYFLVSKSIVDKVYDSYILPDVDASDHTPIGLILTL
ncbi:hypothetical protein AgCh_008146 [Apium graveolens]